MIFKYISEFFQQAKYFTVDLFEDCKYAKKHGKLWKELMPNIKFHWHKAKHHFTITVKEIKTNSFIMSLTKVYGYSYQYELAVAHKRYNHGGWIILHRGNDKHSAINEFYRQLKRMDKLTERSKLQDIISKNTYSWSYKSPWYLY